MQWLIHKGSIKVQVDPKAEVNVEITKCDAWRVPRKNMTTC